MDDSQSQLIAEQLNRLRDNIEARLKRVEASIDHYQKLDEEKILTARNEITSIKKDLDDHEARLRTVNNAVISLKSFATLAQAVQAALTLIAATIAAWLGATR
jgi:hypothetical protein